MVGKQHLHSTRLRERGVTSLFIVIFAALLLSIITVSFISMMVREQQRATDDEQSQSAYDSALAGIEDGKRVMAACRSGVVQACTAISNKECTTVIDAGIQGETNGEVVIQSTTLGDGSELNQAYSCVIVGGDTPDYLAEVASDNSVLIPLRSQSPFMRVTIAWHTSDDAATSSPETGSSVALPQLGSWPTSRPALIRAQLMQYREDNIRPVDFNDGPDAHTVYLYPQTVTGAASFATDARRVGGLQPEAVQCTNGSFPLSGYACQATLTLPGPVGNRAGYLRLTSLYAGTHLQVQLRNAANSVVNFDDVQPMIDSTGRANDLYRRVEARVEMAGPFPYPRATVDITNNFCKTFSVSDVATGYSAGACDPTRAGD
jgi:Tfp pilus assembly protein PilX